MKSILLNPLALLVLLSAPLITSQPVAAQQPTAQLPSLPSATPPTPAAPLQNQVPSATQSSPPEQSVSVQFPHAAVTDVLNFYEELTGKHIIRDSNLTGPELSIMVADKIPQHEAIGIIESSLLLNGYTLVPVDDKTVKILGPSHIPRSEGLPLYIDENQLPVDGDKIVSFYKPLSFLGTDEAATIIQGVVTPNTYGSIVGVPNTGAIIITDKTPVIRKVLALLAVVDKEPTQIITEFIPLERANAESIVDTLNTMFGTGSGGGSHPAGGPPQGNPGAVVSTGGDLHLLSGKPQFIADKRTNRVLIVVKAENYKYLRELIAKLDQPTDSATPLVRPLNYLPVSDIFPVLVTMLQPKGDTNQTALGNQNTNQQTHQNQNQNNNGSIGNNGSSSGAVANPGDKLQDPEQSTPESVTIGSTSIISDPNANSIIVYGPPDTKAKASEIIDLLDQRPKQVYLAAVIGQLQLSEGVDYGASWFAKINNGGNGLVGAAVQNTLSSSLNNLASTALTNVVNNFPTSLSGLTVFGTVAQGIATYAKFLESTGKFRTISRPVVYTSNNKKAVIFSGQNVPIPGTSQANTVGSVGTNSLNSVISTIQYQQVLLKLEVIPLINADKEINLQINQHNDTIGSSNNIGGNSVPTIDTQELTTTVRVPNGSTIVLGGLITDDKTVDNAGIPYINRIPILGALLGGQNTKSRKRSELVVMIQPIVVDSNAAMYKANDAEGAASELGKKATEFQSHLQPSPTPTPKKKKFELFPIKKIDNF